MEIQTSGQGYIKAWSYEMLIPRNSGVELCEDCHNVKWPEPKKAPLDEPEDTDTPNTYNGYGHYWSYHTVTGKTKITCDCSPIFATDEMDRSSVCDNCYYESTLHTIIE